MLGAVCHGKKDPRIELLPERPLDRDEVSGRMDVVQILSGTFPLSQATTVLELAGDRSNVIKHLALNDAPA